MNLRSLGWRLALLAGLVLFGGCASVAPAGAAASPAAAIDPWENWNRKVFAFNEALDEALLKPVATAYRDVVPEIVRRGVGNFFGNIEDFWSAANHFLQGKVTSGLEMGMRVLSNTFFGLAGVLDPATEFGLPKRSEDFGQTLARWGFGDGPYVVLPLFGPSTMRDSLALPLDRYAAAPMRLSEEFNAYLVTPLQLVQARSELLATTKLLGEVALDKYSFVRDGYLSRRRDQIYDGAPPLERFEDDAAEPPATKK